MGGQGVEIYFIKDEAPFTVKHAYNKVLCLVISIIRYICQHYNM